MRSGGGGRVAPVLGIFLTVLSACTKTRSRFGREGQTKSRWIYKKSGYVPTESAMVILCCGAGANEGTRAIICLSGEESRLGRVRNYGIAEGRGEALFAC